MPNRHLETTAATLLSSWTDSDTAMQIVGTSLGLFGPGLLDPTVVLGHETPLRNALFDVLLSLVEGGALDLRPTEDAGYAFRFRTDFATAALSPDTAGAVDIDTPSPYLAELIQVRRERDEALGRADFAEALAAERERLLRIGDAPRAKRPMRRTRLTAAPAVRADAPDEIDLVAIEAEERAATVAEPVADVVIASEAEPEPEVAAIARSAVAAETVVEVEPEIEVEPEVAPIAAAPAPAVAPKPARATVAITGLPPEPVITAVPAPEPEPEVVAVADTEVAPTVESDAAPVAATSKKAPAKKPAAKKPAPKKTATPKKRVAKKPATQPPADAEAVADTSEPLTAATEATTHEAPPIEVPPFEVEAQTSNEVVYLPPPVLIESTDDDSDEDAQIAADDDASARRAKWSGYTLDKPRAHLSSVDRIADDG